MERITIRITRPDLSTYINTFTNCRIRKDEFGISIYLNDCNNTLAGFYPLTWAIEVIKADTID